MAQETTEELLKRTMDFVTQHRATYLATGGSEGHIVNLEHAGARGMLPTLLLKTVGRKSGRTLIVPLIYGVFGDEWAIVGSKGGSPDHPAWYLNLTAADMIEFQVATQAFQGSWRIAEGTERAAVASYMEGLFPPYADYRESAGDREIPMVLLKPVAPVGPFTEPAA